MGLTVLENCPERQGINARRDACESGRYTLALESKGYIAAFRFGDETITPLTAKEDVQGVEFTHHFIADAEPLESVIMMVNKGYKTDVVYGVILTWIGSAFLAETIPHDHFLKQKFNLN